MEFLKLKPLECISLLLLSLFSWFYFLLPSFGRRGVAWSLGRFFQLFGYRKKVIEENIKRAYPDFQAHEIQNLSFEFYTHFGFLVWEILVMFGPWKRFIESNVEYVGFEKLKPLIERGEKLLFLASHVGNWEVAGGAAAMNGLDLMAVTKQLKPQWFHDAFERGRAKAKLACTYEPKTMKDILRQFKKGGQVVITLDQYAGPPISVRVPFFGIPVGTSIGFAMIAKRTQAKVFSVVSHRKRCGKIVAEIQEEIPWTDFENQDYELAHQTAEYAKRIEENVRKYPSQWLWSHRRFKGNLSALSEEEWNNRKALRTLES